MTVPVDTAQDDLESAQGLAAELLEVARRGRPGAVAAAWSQAPGPFRSPLRMAIGAAVEAPDPASALAHLYERLTDWSWAEMVAVRLGGTRHLGVGSMGLTTRMVLEALESLDREVPVIVTPTRATARGLSYLELPIGLGSLAATDTVLVAGIAQHGKTVWTTPLLADAAVQAEVNGTRRVAAVHPLAQLDAAAIRRFQPPSGIVPAAV